MNITQAFRSSIAPGRLALILGSLAGLAVLLTLGGPGITIDEPLDVRPGRKYVDTLAREGLGFFDRATVDRVFRDNAEHPPLGRWLLGIASILGQPLELFIQGSADPLGLYLWAGRLAPAFGFAALVGLVVHASARRYGQTAGWAAGFSLLVMPRVFAHAHLGALDTFIALFWTLALLAADRALTSRRPLLAMTAAGGIWSLALLTKIHAWFLIPVVFVWAFVRLRQPVRSLIAFTLWVATGLSLFVLGWPWLWYDTLSRLRGYLGTGVDRTTLRVLYFGTVYADREVPWHYPWFYFAVTIPLGLHLLGLLGLWRGARSARSDPFPMLLAGSIILFLVVFSTRIPVYDGERLFLVVFPLWSIFIGLGFSALWERLHTRKLPKLGLAFALFGQGYGVVALHPFGLSYYNALVGGLAGAERLDLELTYWNDPVDRVLLNRLARVLPPHAPAALVPTLYPGQGLMTTNRALAGRSTILADQEALSVPGWIVVSRRTAYWPLGLREKVARGKMIMERRRQGVWLSAIYDLTPETPTVGTVGQGSSPIVQAPTSQSADDL